MNHFFESRRAMTRTVATHADASARRRDAIVERVQSHSRRGHAVEDSV